MTEGLCDWQVNLKSRLDDIDSSIGTRKLRIAERMLSLTSSSAAYELDGFIGSKRLEKISDQFLSKGVIEPGDVDRIVKMTTRTKLLAAEQQSNLPPEIVELIRDVKEEKNFLRRDRLQKTKLAKWQNYLVNQDEIDESCDLLTRKRVPPELLRQTGRDIKFKDELFQKLYEEAKKHRLQTKKRRGVSFFNRMKNLITPEIVKKNTSKLSYGLSIALAVLGISVFDLANPNKLGAQVSSKPTSVLTSVSRDPQTTRYCIFEGPDLYYWNLIKRDDVSSLRGLTQSLIAQNDSSFGLVNFDANNREQANKFWEKWFRNKELNERKSTTLSFYIIEKLNEVDSSNNPVNPFAGGDADLIFHFNGVGYHSIDKTNKGNLMRYPIPENLPEFLENIRQ